MKKNLFAALNYDFNLPCRLIAQKPHRPRDKSRLLVLERKKGSLGEKVFKDIASFFKKGDCLVLNNTKVIKARLFGEKETGAKLEVFLVRKLKKGHWECLVKPAKRVKEEAKIFFPGNYQANVKKIGTGLFCLKFYPENIENLIKKSGQVPLPAYIKEKVNLPEYQTVYAQKEGAVAAPTAGLHFSQDLIKKLKNKGVKIIYITLHCSLATFKPVKSRDIRKHDLSSEYLELSQKAAESINKAKAGGKKIFAVGTTGLRGIESAAVKNSTVKAFSGLTGLYIVPGYHFKVADALITNFHTPLSTNLILVSSFASLKLIKKAYAYAQEKEFRFFSFGDAMLIL